MNSELFEKSSEIKSKQKITKTKKKSEKEQNLWKNKTEK